MGKKVYHLKRFISFQSGFGLLLGALAISLASLQAHGQTEPVAPQTSSPQAAAASGSVLGLQNFKMFNDFRYRHQATKQERSADRYRDRIRLRVGVKFDLEENVKAQFRLASGETGDTALSTNQSLGNGGEKKAIWIDQAFLKWQPTENFDLRLGKMQNMWWEPLDAQFVFDEDYTPEGFSGEWVTDGDTSKFFVSAHAHWIKERGTATAVATEQTSKDTSFLGSQIGWRFNTAENRASVVASYLTVPNLEGSAVINNGGRFSGNTSRAFAGGNVYANDYEVVTLGAEWVYLGGLPEPLTLLVLGAQNLQADEKNRALTAGVAFGEIKEKGDWLVSYKYRYAEADALLAALSDSDLGTATDSRGHVVTVKYGLTQKLSLSGTYYAQEINMSSTALNFQRIHADLVAKF